MFLKRVLNILLFTPLFFYSTSSFANLIQSDKSLSCQVSNGWTFQLDLYWQGHPQGPGGWSAVGQINDWGKFTLISQDNKNIFLGENTGPSRLSPQQIKISLKDQMFSYRVSHSMGGYLEWQNYSMNCK